MIYQDYVNSANYIKNKIKGEMPETAVILGSGLSAFSEEIEKADVIDYKDIPNFPESTVQSHKGKMYIGKIGNKNVLCMAGRFHFYEGYEMNEVAFPVRIMKLLGIKNLILTNAAGGINTDFVPGDLMLIQDHIKLCDASPVRGNNIKEFGERFFDMTYAYAPEYQKTALNAAKKLNIDLKTGVYAYMAGPQFETPAEIRALRTLGADAVGMSTVAETITAAQCGIKTLGISCISNMAAGMSGEKISDDDVCEVANRRMSDFVKLICEIIKNI